MRLIFMNEDKQPSESKYALLIKDSIAHKDKIKEYYLDKLSPEINPENILIIGLDYETKTKASAKFVKEKYVYIDRILQQYKVENLLIADSIYFKILTKVKKVTPHFGYIVQSTLEKISTYNCVLSINYQQLFYDPALEDKLNLSLKTFKNAVQGIHFDIGSNIIHKAIYPKSLNEINEELDKLHQYPILTCDIETFGLALKPNSIGSIAFAWSEHKGMAFKLSAYIPTPAPVYLKNFFKEYKGTLIFHNGSFDIKHLIYNLFMTNPLDNKGLIEGLETFYPKVHDTKIIAYLATNSTTGNSLSLKELSHEFAGNYAVDVTDITQLKDKELLEYNLIDCLSTWYVFNKYWQKLIDDNQLDIYNNIMLPSMKVITHMELTGMPMDMNQVNRTSAQLENELITAKNIIFSNRIILNFEKLLRLESMLSANAKLKKKVKPLSDFDDITYNPGSNTQTAKLLFDFIGLEVLDLTDGGAPSTGSKTIKKLQKIITDPEINEVLSCLIKIADISIILNTFVKAFKTKSIKKDDGMHYLHGNFNLGGTVSGRLSSNSPNLMNLPSSGTPYAKPIKKCFTAPTGSLMVGADFASLEDRISALLTKDKNKLAVYLDGYDSHALRAYSYYKEHMPDIENTVESINSITKKYPEFRQKSKTPTFLLTYGGSFHGIIDQCGIPEDEAKTIEANYHELYKESDEWVQGKLKQAEKDGYVTCAFGLRVRTPILKQTIAGKKSTPYEAASEGRTAGNALGQSFGLLNNRAAIEFMGRVYKSIYKYDISPICHVHDSQYFIIKNTYGCVKWFNDNLVECMEWQDLPEIYHPEVGLGGEIDIFYEGWHQPITIKNKATKSEIRAIIKKGVEDYKLT